MKTKTEFCNLFIRFLFCHALNFKKKNMKINEKKIVYKSAMFCLYQLLFFLMLQHVNIVLIIWFKLTNYYELVVC